MALQWFVYLVAAAIRPAWFLAIWGRDDAWTPARDIEIIAN